MVSEYSLFFSKWHNFGKQQKRWLISDIVSTRPPMKTTFFCVEFLGISCTKFNIINSRPLHQFNNSPPCRKRLSIGTDCSRTPSHCVFLVRVCSRLKSFPSNVLNI